MDMGIYIHVKAAGTAEGTSQHIETNVQRILSTIRIRNRFYELLVTRTVFIVFSGEKIES